MSWKVLSRDNFISAKRLYEAGLWRSAVSRAYYSVFAAVTFRLPTTVIPQRLTAPRHRDLPVLITGHFGWLQWHQREAIRAAAQRAYAARLLADYNPTRLVDRRMAKQSVQDAVGVLKRLGVEYGD